MPNSAGVAATVTATVPAGGSTPVSTPPMTLADVTGLRAASWVAYPEGSSMKRDKPPLVANGLAVTLMTTFKPDFATGVVLATTTEAPSSSPGVSTAGPYAARSSATPVAASAKGTVAPGATAASGMPMAVDALKPLATASSTATSSAAARRVTSESTAGRQRPAPSCAH